MKNTTEDLLVSVVKNLILLILLGLALWISLATLDEENIKDPMFWLSIWG